MSNKLDKEEYMDACKKIHNIMRWIRENIEDEEVQDELIEKLNDLVGTMGTD